MTILRQESARNPGVRYLRENPLPCFRARQENADVEGEGLSIEENEGLGWQTSYRVLPDRVQDDFSADLIEQDFPAVILENQFLRATFLPSLGARLVSLLDKERDRELLFHNPDIRMRNLGTRNAWFAGGIEWNWGVWGHSTLTSSPMFAARIEGPAGEPGVRFYEYARCHGLVGQLDFHLPEESRLLLVCTRIMNTRSREVPFYYWTNIAVPEAEDVRVLAPADEGINPVPPTNRIFRRESLPRLGILGGRDISYSLRAPFSHELFFRIPDERSRWIAALDGGGAGFFEASTAALRSRKIFVWGNHQGGRQWQEYLSRPGMAYLEIQAGASFTQRHMMPVEAYGERSWTEAFGALQADPVEVHGSDWTAAWKSAGEAVARRIPPDRLAQLHEQFTSVARRPPLELFHYGSGWGALEGVRKARSGEPGMPCSTPFPEDSTGSEQEPWRKLLQDGRLPESGGETVPQSWMIQDEWRRLLEASLKESPDDWQAWLHLGVAWREALEFEQAEYAWRRSIALVPNVIALRSLGCLAAEEGRTQTAMDFFERAFDLAPKEERVAADIAAEWIVLLNGQQQHDRALEIWQSLPEASRCRDLLRLRRAEIALGKGETELLEAILNEGFATIREGQGSLTDLWWGLWEYRASNGRPGRLGEAERARIRIEHPLPRHLDFTVVSPELVESIAGRTAREATGRAGGDR